MPPTKETGLSLEITLPDMIYVWRGDLPLARALATGRLRAHGTVEAQRVLPRWLAVSPLAHVQSARAEAKVV